MLSVASTAETLGQYLDNATRFIAALQDLLDTTSAAGLQCVVTGYYTATAAEIHLPANLADDVLQGMQLTIAAQVLLQRNGTAITSPSTYRLIGMRWLQQGGLWGGPFGQPGLLIAPGLRLIDEAVQ